MSGSEVAVVSWKRTAMTARLFGSAITGALLARVWVQNGCYRRNYVSIHVRIVNMFEVGERSNAHL
jgi:hypothetical protein